MRNAVKRTLFQLSIFLLSAFFIRTKIIRAGEEFLADFKLVEEDRRIKSNCIGNFTQLTLRKCIYKCIRNKSCETFNYHEGEQICEILKISKFDQVGLLEPSRGWNHYETDCNERKIGSVCMKIDYCKEYETCEETFDNTLYKCRCPDGFNGTKCEQYIDRGSSESNPAPACSLILPKYTTLPDGYYWIKKKNGAVKKYCRRKGTGKSWSSWGYCEYANKQTRVRKCHDPRADDLKKENCDDEIEERACKHKAVSSCREIKGMNPYVKSGLFTLSNKTNAPIKVYCNMTTGAAIYFSCKEIKMMIPDAKTGLFKLWSKMNKEIKVYCDMETGEGGWMLIGNVIVDGKMDNDGVNKFLSRIRSTNIAELFRAQSNSFLFDASYLHNLKTNFSQLRFYCHKNEKTIHIRTLKSANNVMDFFLAMEDEGITRPDACETFRKYKDDNSVLSQDCTKWPEQKWGLPNDGNDLYNFPFFSVTKAVHYGLGRGRMECDDFTDPNIKTKIKIKGVWKVYVR